jgi:hypothetical protein
VPVPSAPLPKVFKINALYKKKEAPQLGSLLSFFIYIAFTQDVAPRAVRTAVAIDAMICTTNLKVSFLVIMLSV